MFPFYPKALSLLLESAHSRTLVAIVSRNVFAFMVFTSSVYRQFTEPV